MATVRRYDRAVLRIDAQRTQQGFLRCDAAIARTGVQVYRMQDGSERREYRPPEEVFHPDAMASFRIAPLTLGHPAEPVTEKNAAAHIKGTVIDPRQDGHLVRATVQVTHADAIQAAIDGSSAEISCGYDCDLDSTPGTAPSGEKYDAIQRNIRGNHVALVSKGRAGPDVRLKLDAADGEQVTPITETPPAPLSQKGQVMIKITIDGVECEVSEVAAQLIRKQDAERAEKKKKREDAQALADKVHTDALAAKDKELAAAKVEADKQKARADAAEVAKEAAEKARKDAEDPKKVAAVVAARVALESSARSILGADAKLDGKTDLEVRREVVVKAMPSLKLDGKSDAYVEALFDSAVADEAKRNPMDRARGALSGGDGGGAGANREDEVDAAKAREDMLKAREEAAKPKTAAK